MQTRLREKVLERVDENKEDILKFTQKLIRVPSIVGTSMEGKAQEVFIEEVKKKLVITKIDVWEPEIDEIMKYPLYPIRISEWSYKGRPNVVCTIGENSEKSLILNGHIDVVSPEPLDAWKHDPWSGEIDDDKIYGRGSCDMKAGLAAMVYAVTAIQEADIDIKNRIIIESVVEEECGGGGTIATLLRGYKGDAVIITESTGSENICIGECGSRFFTIKILGKSQIAHSSHKGVNAIDLAIKIYNSLNELNLKRINRIKGKYPLFEKENIDAVIGTGIPNNLVMGIFRAGDWPTTLAGWAEIQGRIGFSPYEKGEDVIKQVEETIKKVSKSDPWLKNNMPLVQWWGPRKEGYILNGNESIISILRKNIMSLLNKKARIYATSVNTDASFFVTKANSYGGIPTVIYGPYGRGAHSSDEYVSISDLLLTTKILALSILNWLLQ